VVETIAGRVIGQPMWAVLRRPGVSRVRLAAGRRGDPASCRIGRDGETRVAVVLDDGLTKCDLAHGAGPRKPLGLIIDYLGPADEALRCIGIADARFGRSHRGGGRIARGKRQKRCSRDEGIWRVLKRH
jgi:hypothetical protein